MKLSKKPFIIVLDLTNCKTLYDVRETIRKTFNFPEWYGKNWSAFDDLLYAPEEYTVIQLRGYTVLPKNIASYCTKIVDILEKKKKYYKKMQDKFNIQFDYIIIN